MSSEAGAAIIRKPPAAAGGGSPVRNIDMTGMLGPPSEATWLQPRRRAAAAWVETNGFPTTTNEDWRYTKIDTALAVPLVASTAEPFEAVAPAFPEIGLPEARPGGARFVVVNGRVVPSLSALGRLPDGARIEALSDALRRPDPLLEEPWACPAKGYPHALRALNDAMALDGVLIELAAGTEVADPIEIVFVSLPVREPRWWHPRVIVAAGPGSCATMVETYLGVDGLSVTNALTQARLGAGAELVHFVLQAESTSSDHFSCLEARLAQRSRLSSRLLATGSRIGRHEVDAVLAGEEAEVTLDGLFLTGQGQHHDNPVRIEHAAPRCTSRQLYKGVVSGDGHGVFNGHVVVRPGADGTDAAQVNKNLLLSERAQVDTRPRLEIFADDVACSHGAAVGELDPDALFYLRSRGVDEGVARAVLVSGFAQELLDRFEPTPIQERAQKLAEAAGLLTLNEPTQGPGAGPADPATARTGGPREPEVREPT